MESSPEVGGTGSQEQANQNQGRRAVDRLLRRGTEKGGRHERHELENLLLFVDDDLREAALALSGIESFLTKALHLLEKEKLEAQDMQALAGDLRVLDRMDVLGESVASLRRRMGLIAESLKG